MKVLRTTTADNKRKIREKKEKIHRELINYVLFSGSRLKGSNWSPSE